LFGNAVDEKSRHAKVFGLLGLLVRGVDRHRTPLRAHGVQHAVNRVLSAGEHLSEMFQVAMDVDDIGFVRDPRELFQVSEIAVETVAMPDDEAPVEPNRQSVLVVAVMLNFEGRVAF
jgi:hypothetical protein